MSEQQAVPAEDNGQPATSGQKPVRGVQYACSFCGKKQHQVWRLIAGPGVYICSECILLCVEMFVEGAQPLLDDEATFRVAVRRPDGTSEQLSFGPLPEAAPPTADCPGGKRWLLICPACGAINIGDGLDTCLHCNAPLPRPGEPPNRPSIPWLVGFTRKELRAFTPPLRATLELAEAEALHLNHRYIGTEHLLLGLFRLQSGSVTELLAEHGLTPDALQQAVVAIIGRGTVAVAAVKGYSQRAGEVVRAAMAEAKKRGQSKVAPEHLLLALLAEGKGVGAMALTALGVDLDAVHVQVVQRLVEPGASMESR